MGTSESAQAESYVLSLLAEGKHRAAFEVIPEFGSPGIYARHFANLGYRLWRGGKADEAADVLRRAVRLDPKLASGWLTLGMVNLSQDDLEEGDPYLAKAISLDSSAAAAHYLRGVVAKRLGREGEAVEYLGRCLEVRPSHQEAAAELRGLIGGTRREDFTASRAREALARAERSPEAERSGATLSACVIARNEEESLPRCLGSLRPAADQIVVVDTGSTDDTLEVARRLGAEVYEFEWCDDFAAARNAAIARASCEWVLIVDADEELPGPSAEQLRELLGSRISGSVCQLVTHAPASRAGVGLVGHPRLFRNGEGIHFRGAVHEQLVDREGRPIEEVMFAGIPVMHHGYLEPEAAMEERGRRNLRLLSARAEAEPDDGSVLFCLGRAQMGAGQVEEGVETLRRALEPAEEGRGFRVRGALLLAHGLCVLERAEESEEVLSAALADHPEHPELLCVLGRELERQGRAEEAVAAYRAATRGCFGPTLEHQDFTCRDVRPRGRLAAIHLSRGEAEAAAEEARAGLAIRPECVEVRHLLAAALLSLDRWGEARAELETILAGNPDDARAHNSLGVGLALGGDHGRAAREFEFALALNPDDVDTLCNLGLSRHAKGDLSGARDAWEEALKGNPSHVRAWLGLARTYLGSGAYEAGARCYQMAAAQSGESPEVMAEIETARAALARLAEHGRGEEG